MAAGQPEERRIVTVVFADLIGFTTVAEYLDPEQSKRLVDSCFEQLVGDITSFGGRVDKIMGDGLLALFGAPIAHEDDPERAVRASLRMQHTLAERVATSPLIGGADIRMRVGVNTGEVLVGTLAGTDYTAMGDVVNTAARLQTAAPPGGVMVGESTYGLTSHTFRYESAGQLEAKGREQPVHGWLAIEATAPPGARRWRNSDVGMVGRDAELALARSTLELAIGAKGGVLLAVIGESGVGKSRLVDELLRWVRDTTDAHVLEGTCAPYGEANVWWPIATALTASLGLEPGLTLDETLDAARSTATTMHPEIDPKILDRFLGVFSHLLGLPSPIDQLDAASARSAIHQSVVKLLDTITQSAPVVLSIDDLRWADPLVIDLLDTLVESLGRRRFTLVTAMRPGSDLNWPPNTDRATVVSLNLQPLSRADTERLASELLRDLAPDAKLLSTLFDRSGGNPLFLHELAALTQSGAGADELPDSLRSLIGARLDQLTAQQRQVIDNAAILGTSGAIYSLVRFALETNQSYNETTVSELVDLGLLDVIGSRWEFRSDSVREAAYQTLTKASRALRHAGVAKAMGEGGARSAEDVAHHVASAAELVQELGPVEGVPTDIAARAIELLTASADRALASGMLKLAVHHATRAIGLIRADPAMAATLAHLHLVRAEAEVDQRTFDAARTDIDAVLDYATISADAVLEGDARRLLGNLHHRKGQLDLARAELGRSVELLRDSDNPDKLARALRARGFIELFGGVLPDAEWYFGEADGLYRELDDQHGMAWVEQNRAWAAFLSGDTRAAHAQLHHAADTLERLGDRNGVGWAFGLLAFVEFFEGNFVEAESLAVTVEHEAEERGDDWAAAMMQTLRADLRLWHGKIDESVRLAEQARSKFRKLNDTFGMMQAMAPLLRGQVALGQTAAAQRSAEELVALAESSVLGPFPFMAVAGAAMHRGDARTAISMAQRAITEVEAAGGGPREPAIILALALAQDGQLDEATATFESIDELAAGHPFAEGVGALIRALSHDSELALQHVAAVEAAPGSTYLDEVFAYIAAAAAHAQLAHNDQAELSAQAAVVRAMSVRDVVATALATRAFEMLTGELHPATDRVTSLGDGWTLVLDSLFG